MNFTKQLNCFKKCLKKEKLYHKTNTFPTRLKILKHLENVFIKTSLKKVYYMIIKRKT